jgi:hypothetical protein
MRARTCWKNDFDVVLPTSLVLYGQAQRLHRARTRCGREPVMRTRPTVLFSAQQPLTTSQHSHMRVRSSSHYLHVLID